MEIVAGLLLGDDRFPLWTRLDLSSRTGACSVIWPTGWTR